MAEEIEIKYKVCKPQKVQIFGELFVENNRKNCKLKINGKESDLIEAYYYNPDKNNLLEIKLILF